jgi:hypothetical protein
LRFFFGKGQAARGNVVFLYTGFAFAAYLPESNPYMHGIKRAAFVQTRRPLRVKACMEMCHETL